MKILFLSQHYWPEPCDTRTSQLAALMSAKGHSSTALTTFPNYPFGKVYKGYEQCIVEKEVRDGVSVVRVPMLTDHSKSRLKRGASYLSFCVTAFFLGALFTKRPDLIWIHHPPLTTAVAGYMLAKLKRVPFVLEIHDLWPETLISTGMIRQGRVTRAISTVCGFLYRRAAKIIVSSPGMKENLVQKGVPSTQIEIVYQWADERLFQPTKRNEVIGAKFGLKGKTNVIFAGNQGTAQALDTVLDAAKRLQDVANLQFVLVGSGVETARLLSRAAKEKINNVRFIPHQNTTQMPGILAWADALLIHLRDDPLFAVTVPSKTQTYMAMGKPILCGVRGDTSQVIRDAQCGLDFDPECPKSMESAVRDFLIATPEQRIQMAESALAYYRENFSQRRSLLIYEQMFRKIVSPSLSVEQASEDRSSDKAA